MGEKKNKGGDNKNGETQKNDGTLTVVLKADFHCEGCATKVIKALRSFQGVEKVTCDADSNKVTVTGKVDPVILREKVEQKTHKHIELISPKKDKKDGENGGGEGKKKQPEKDTKEKKAEGEDKKTKVKEPPVTTMVLKVHLHCQGCIQKIHKIVTKSKGYKEMKVDKQKDLVTVTGSMDMKELVETLKKHLKKDIEIVPPKKDGGEKKDNGGDGEKGNGGGGKGKGKGGGEGKKVNEQGGGDMMMMMGNGMQMMPQQVQFGYPYPYMYGPVYPTDEFQNPYAGSVHAPQLFSDENPNACSVM